MGSEGWVEVGGFPDASDHLQGFLQEAASMSKPLLGEVPSLLKQLARLCCFASLFDRSLEVALGFWKQQESIFTQGLLHWKMAESRFGGIQRDRAVASLVQETLVRRIVLCFKQPWRSEFVEYSAVFEEPQTAGKSPNH